MDKINQLKINILEEEKIKYYVAFSYLQVRPLFKSKLFEYFDYDIKRAFLADSEDIKKVAQYYDIQAPRDFVSKRDKLDMDECFKQAFLDEEVKILSKLANEALGGIKGKGFMYSLPISYLEGLDN